MSFKSTLLTGFAVLATTSTAWAQGTIEIHDAYARSSNAKAGAAFMAIHNHGGEEDRLIDVRSDVAEHVQLHTHIEDENGVMKMRHVEGGFAVPADGMLMLKRGGDHVMFMGLKTPFEDGALIPVTLVFEKAGEIASEIEVDQDRKAQDDHSAD